MSDSSPPSTGVGRAHPHVPPMSQPRPGAGRTPDTHPHICSSKDLTAKDGHKTCRAFMLKTPTPFTVISARVIFTLIKVTNDAGGPFETHVRCSFILLVLAIYGLLQLDLGLTFELVRSSSAPSSTACSQLRYRPYPIYPSCKKALQLFALSL